MSIDTVTRIVEMSRAGYPAMYLLTSEDTRAQREVKEAAQIMKRKVFVWTLEKGVVEDTGKPNGKPIPGTGNPNELLAYLPKLPSQSILILRLFHHFMEDPLVQSTLLDILPNYKNESQRILVITTPIQKLPAEVEKEFAVIEMDLPDKKAIGEVLDGIIQGSKLTGDRIPDEQL